MKLYLEEIKNKIKPVIEKYGVIRAAIFGSYARGDYNSKSDIDFLIEFGGKKSLLDLISVKMELEETLHKKVDVVTYNSLHPLLKRKILAEQMVLV